MKVLIIGDNAFLGCQGITSVIVPSGVYIIGKKAFAYNENLETVMLPKGLEHIGSGAFNGCSSLSSIKLPDGLATIGNYAFVRCSKLSSVEIPKTVTSFGSGVFEECKALKELKCLLAEPPAINANVFHKLDKSKVTLYVPKASLSKYKQAAVWKEFGEIKSIEQGMAVEAPALLDVKVYPNPACSYAEISGLKAYQEVKLFSLEGRLVFSCRADAGGIAVVRVENFSKGIYMLQGEGFSRKLIIR